MIEGSKILIVDDNPDIVEVLSDFLQLSSCEVYKASTGKEAIEALGKYNVEIVLLDLKLPDTNGIALLDTVKEHDPTIAVIMMTGHHDPDFIIDAMKKGASDFLMKPFEIDKLMLMIMRVFKQRELLLERTNILQQLGETKKIEVLNRELQKKIAELTTMYHISNKFNSCNIFEDIYEKTVLIVTEILGQNCGYYIMDNEKSELILYREKTKDNGFLAEKIVPLSPDFLSELQSARKHFMRGEKLFLPLTIKGECIGFLMVHGSTNGNKRNGRFQDSDIFFLRLIAEKASTQIENRMLYESLFESVLHTLRSLIVAINKRDWYTEGHCKRVTGSCLSLASRVPGITDYEKDVLRVVGPIHDLGKIGIPDAILLKPGKLADEEYAVMKGHSISGEEIMSRFEILSNEAKIIRHHHERFDGGGYPDHLAAGDIPLCSRVIAVCDTYDAMVTNRPYRAALDTSEALAEIRRCKGLQFDPDIADVFTEMMSDGEH
jgi:response regulator RpfG family c-di-GMP phosphodiesterase